MDSVTKALIPDFTLREIGPRPTENRSTTSSRRCDRSATVVSRVDRRDGHRVIDAEEVEDTSHRTLVISPIIVVDQSEHLLGMESSMITAQLFRVGDMAGVKQFLWSVGSPWRATCALDPQVRLL